MSREDTNLKPNRQDIGSDYPDPLRVRRLVRKHANANRRQILHLHWAGAAAMPRLETLVAIEPGTDAFEGIRTRYAVQGVNGGREELRGDFLSERRTVLA